MLTKVAMPAALFLLTPSLGGYEHFVKGCVNGHNIALYKERSVAECKQLCDADDRCLAFEYGVNYGAAVKYKARDCQLQSSKDRSGCDGSKWNLDLFVKDALSNGDGLVMGLMRSELNIDNGKEMCVRSVNALSDSMSLDSDDPIKMAECDDQDVNQMWAYDKVTGGIWSVANGKRFDDAGGRKAINNKVQLWPRRRTDENKHDGSEFRNMRWSYDPYTRVVSLGEAPELCLDWNFAEGDKRSLRTYLTHEGDNQKWDFVEVPMVEAEPHFIVSRDRSRGFMCVAAQNRHDGHGLKMEPCDFRNELHVWSRNLNTGAIWITKKEGDWRVMDVENGREKLGTEVQTWGSAQDPRTSANGNNNMWFDYCPLTGQIRWRANNDRVLRWDQHSNRVVTGASWDLPSAVNRLSPSQQFDFVRILPLMIGH